MREIIGRGIVASIGKTTIWRWLSEDALRPWRHRSWIFPRDPDFAEKVGRGTVAVFYDIATEKRIGPAAAPHPYTALGMYACAGGAYTEKMFLDLMEAAAAPPLRGRSLPFPYLGSSGAHATCITGDIVAHGMIYQPQQGCR